MSAEQTPDIETVRSVVWQTLSEHQWGVWSCSCGEADGEYEDNHLADVIAQALAPVLAAAVREALREAADDPSLRLKGHSGISITRLRDRADRVAEPQHEAATSGKESEAGR